MKQDLTEINTLEDLQAKIRHLKIAVKERELDLEDRWKRVPEETFKVAVGSIVPMFLTTRAYSGTWSLLKGAFNLFRAKSDTDAEGGNWKEKLIASAKKVGISTLLTAAVKLIKK